MEMQELEADFEVLHRFLAGEQVLLLRQLQERHEALLARQRRNLGALEERSSALRRLIADAEAAGRQDGLQLLKVGGKLGVGGWDGLQQLQVTGASSTPFFGGKGIIGIGVFYSLPLGSSFSRSPKALPHRNPAGPIPH